MSKSNSLNGSSSSGIRYGPEMRILIVGGGIAGLTLCALLEQRGFSPTVVERAHKYGNVGYVIVLWPSGSKILKGIGLYEDLKKVGCDFGDYKICDYKGNSIHTYTIDPVVEKYGPVISVYRPDLMNVLSKGVRKDSVRMNTALKSLEETDDDITAYFSDGTSGTYDLVVGCDGIYSKTRSEALGKAEISYSGMAGYAFWSSLEFSEINGITEYWGTGKFVKIWPTHNRLAVFVSVRTKPDISNTPEEKIKNIQEYLSDFGGVVPDIIRNLDDPYGIYYTEYNDLKISRWSSGRVVLVGDSAHAILPNAGGGTSMAMESASVLTEELCRTDSKYFPQAIRQYEARRKRRVDKVLNHSRFIGKFFLTDSGPLSLTRNYIMKIYSSRQIFRYWDGILSDAL